MNKPIDKHSLARFYNAKKAALAERMKNHVHATHWRAHCLLPNHLPPPGDNDKEYYKKRDQEQNVKSDIPADEELTVEAFWALELYGPSEVEDLRRNLKKLGWNAGSLRPEEGNASNWLGGQLASGGAGSWYNVGLVTRRGERRGLPPQENYADLPAEIDYLKVTILQVTDSLTCVSTMFVLKPELTGLYASEIRKPRKTYKEKSTGWSIIAVGPEQQKKRAIDAIRLKLQKVATTWVMENIPGYFCKAVNTKILTAEVLTTKNAPLISTRSEKRTAWAQTVGEPHFMGAWVSSDDSALRLSGDFDTRGDNESHVLVSLCSSKLKEDSLKFRGGHTRGAYLSFCEDTVGKALAIYAAQMMLYEVSRDLKASRTTLGIASIRGKKSDVILERIQEFFDRTVGIPAVLAELKNESSDVGFRSHALEAFTAPNWRNNESPRALSESFCRQIKYLTTQILTAEHSAREHFEQLSSVLSVRESVRAQKKMEWLTVIALAVSLASLGVAVLALK